MKFNIILGLVGVVLSVGMFSCSGKKDSQTSGYIGPTAPVDKGWSFDATPDWSDDFNYTGTPDTSKWTYDLGTNGGWGNNELEDYTNSLSNVSVANGILTITAKKESVNGANYTSARIVSKGTGSLTYGRIEIRAQLPAGRGTWPAIWMLPNNYVYGAWPNSGEVDIMEMVGYAPDTVHFSTHNELHYGGNAETSTYAMPGASTGFHLFREDWTPYAIRGYYDNNLVFTYINTGAGSPAWPYNQNFHLLMNIAVGGSWGGLKGVDDSAFPTTMQIDYVHFFNMIPQ